MSRKRTLCQNVGFKKKLKTQPTSEDQSWADDGMNFDDVGCDTKSALLYIKSLFHVEIFENRLPPIILLHQLYSIINSRTVVDKQVGELREAGVIRLFKLGVEDNTSCVVFTDDYKLHVIRFIQQQSIDRQLIDRFLETAVTTCHDINFNRQKLTSLHFTDSDITQLVKAGVLTVRDVGSWWLAIPSAGVFTKSLAFGRRSLRAVLKRCKYRQILQKDLETKKLPKAAKLGMAYHIHDLIGADIIESVTTSSGPLLRLHS